MIARERRRAREALLRWFDREARSLPWRTTRDPYAIWVSEVMLQQTRVETVIPYYERFLARFPTTHALAAASEDEVLAAWSGLGYYRRARLLHAGVREVVARHGGALPRDAEARRSLPGIGRYTAGAIGSIAFELEEPIVDGNVARVLSRLTLLEAPLGSRESERALWAEAQAWAEGPRPGAANQALMELGATVCVPVAPRCEACPLRGPCAARAAGRAAELPAPRAKKAPREVSLVALVALDPDGRALVRKAVNDGADDEGAEGSRQTALGGELFRGLWGVPMAEGEGRGVARALADEVGASLRTSRPIEVGHVLTHRRLRVSVFEGKIARASPGARLVDAPGLSALGVATLTRKLLASVRPEAFALPARR
jgi:A/G-specific adenine glycosylase